MTHHQTMIVGGTGLLGFHTATSLANRTARSITSVSTGSLSADDLHVDPDYPRQITHQQQDIFGLGVDQLTQLFAGHQAVIYAVGPDDRVVPSRPAASFFDEHLVATIERVCLAAEQAGVEHLIVFGSYFTYLDRIEPERRLAERHPYIGARARQLQRCQQADGHSLLVSVFEIPYVFGTIPARDPLWNDMLVSRLNKMRPWIFFPNGGTAATSAGYVGRAAAMAIERGVAGPIPIGEQNIDWATMLAIASEELYGSPRRVLTIPKTVAATYGAGQQAVLRIRGLEPGLSYARYMMDIQSEHSYFPDDLIDTVADRLGLQRGSIEPALRETFARCRQLN